MKDQRLVNTFLTDGAEEDELPREYAEGFIKMLSCICPHIGEELWERLGHSNSVFDNTWPTYDENKMVDSEVKVAVQINGKTKTVIEVDAEISKEDVIAKAKEALGDKLKGDIIKEIYVPKKIVNIVAK